MQNRFFFQSIPVLVLWYFFTACSASKKNNADTAIKYPILVSENLLIDTAASLIPIAPDTGTTIFIQSMVVYISKASNPGVAFTIKRKNGDKQVSILPHIKNGETYSFGGGMKYTLYNGDVGELTAVELETTLPVNAVMTIKGYKQKTVKQ